MKNLIAASALFALTSIAGFHTASASNNSCSLVIAGANQSPKLTNWRVVPTAAQKTKFMSLTNLSQSGKFFKTNAAREQGLKEYAEEVIEFVWTYDNDAYGMRLVPQVGENFKTIQEAGAYTSGILEHVEATGIGADGILHATLGLPVSGRYGNKQTMQWALNDKYDVMIGDAQGRNRRPLLSNVQSRMIVTMQEIEVPLKKGDTISLFYERHGSAGSAGFQEGRIIYITWNGK